MGLPRWRSGVDGRTTLHEMPVKFSVSARVEFLRDQKSIRAGEQILVEVDLDSVQGRTIQAFCRRLAEVLNSMGLAEGNLSEGSDYLVENLQPVADSLGFELPRRGKFRRSSANGLYLG